MTTTTLEIREAAANRDVPRRRRHKAHVPWRTKGENGKVETRPLELEPYLRSEVAPLANGDMGRVQPMGNGRAIVWNSKEQRERIAESRRLTVVPDPEPDPTPDPEPKATTKGEGRYRKVKIDPCPECGKDDITSMQGYAGHLWSKHRIKLSELRAAKAKSKTKPKAKVKAKVKLDPCPKCGRTEFGSAAGRGAHMARACGIPGSSRATELRRINTGAAS